jgi:hypothetical protein
MSVFYCHISFWIDVFNNFTSMKHVVIVYDFYENRDVIIF